MFKLTAYHHWLLRESGGEKAVLIDYLKADIANQNPQAFDLLEMTGDKKYTAETFEKAADLLLSYPLTPTNEPARD